MSARTRDAEEVVGDDQRWMLALRPVSDLQPTTVAGLHAKTRLALPTLPFGSARVCLDWGSPNGRLIWSLLRDLLALSDCDEP